MEPPGQGLPPCPTPCPLPVIVLADASHRAQGLQVVIGLSGAEAVQRLAAPWVPVGGSEVDGHLGEGGGGGHAAAVRTHRQARPELEYVKRTKVDLGEPLGSLIVEQAVGFKVHEMPN